MQPDYYEKKAREMASRALASAGYVTAADQIMTEQDSSLDVVVRALARSLEPVKCEVVGKVALNDVRVFLDRVSSTVFVTDGASVQDIAQTACDIKREARLLRGYIDAVKETEKTS